MTDNHSRTVALVGCGHWGKNLARNFEALGALHTICDVDAAKNTAFQATYPEVRFESEFSRLLENQDIKQVAIAAPAVLHYDMCKRALLAGKDVYVEKPFCMKVEEAVEIRNLAEKLSRIVMVGHLLQYHPAVCRLQELMRDGVFGKLYRITSNRLNLGKVRTEENALWSLAPHDISVVLSLVGKAAPTSVSAFHKSYLNRGIADCSLVDIEFTGGINAQIQVSWLHPFKEQKLSIIGDAAMAVFDDTLDWSSKLVLRRDYFSQKESASVSILEDEPLRNECRHFIECCKERNKPKTDPCEAIGVLQILETAEQSALKNGLRIDMPTGERDQG